MLCLEPMLAKHEVKAPHAFMSSQNASSALRTVAHPAALILCDCNEEYARQGLHTKEWTASPGLTKVAEGQLWRYRIHLVTCCAPVPQTAHV